MTDSLFAYALKVARRNADMSVNRLADLSGVEYSTIAGWEMGRLPRRTLAVVKVARVLEVSNDELFIPLIEEFERREKTYG